MSRHDLPLRVNDLCFPGEEPLYRARIYAEVRRELALLLLRQGAWEELPLGVRRIWNVYFSAPHVVLSFVGGGFAQFYVEDGRVVADLPAGCVGDRGILAWALLVDQFPWPVRRPDLGLPMPMARATCVVTPQQVEVLLERWMAAAGATEVAGLDREVPVPRWVRRALTWFMPEPPPSP